jgi:hypothetical protein
MTPQLQPTSSSRVTALETVITALNSQLTEIKRMPRRSLWTECHLEMAIDALQSELRLAREESREEGAK